MPKRAFQEIVKKLGQKPSEEANQNESRHYSEVFSKELALWLREEIISSKIGAQVLQPEGKVDTIYGTGNRGKSLDVGVVDENKYLILNISIKTFNFKDKKTKNYRHNYTGRFYELLGEDLDLRRSYPLATLVALIFLPQDSTYDTDPSSFAHAIRQFSKIIKKDREEHELGFEYVYIGIHDEQGNLYFFDAAQYPPRIGAPLEKDRKSVDLVIEELKLTVDTRRKDTKNAQLPAYKPFKFTEPTIESIEIKKQ